LSRLKLVLHISSTHYHVRVVPLSTVFLALVEGSLFVCACLVSAWSQGSQYSVWLWTGRPGFNPRQRQRISPPASASRPALGPTQPPVQWVLGVFFLGLKRGWGVMLTTHPHLVLRLRMSRSYTSSHPMCFHGV
jgi:hypothetical protein